MSLRWATLDDTDVIVDLILNEKDHFVHGHLLTNTATRDFVIQHLVKPRQIAVSLVAVDLDECIVGLFFGLRAVLPMTETPVAIEVIWWVDSKYRRAGVSHEIKDAAENWAKLVGCHYLHFTASNTVDLDLLSRYYKINGFVETERNFLKAI